MTRERFEELYERYCDGSLSAAELEQFKSSLKDPAHARTFVEYSMFEAVINDELRLTEEAPAAEERARRGVSSIRQAVRIPKSQVKRRTSRIHGSWRLPAIAAAFVLACLLGFWVYRTRSPVEIARLEAVRNTTLQRGGQTSPAANGAVSDGDTLSVAIDGAARLVYPDGTTLDLRGGTGLTVTSTAGAKTIRLNAGALSAVVARQPAEKPASIVTPHSSTTVVGTRLSVSAMEQTTRVSVLEGEVNVRSAEGGEEARVSAGKYVVAAKGLALETKALPSAGRMVEDFESGHLKDWHTSPFINKSSKTSRQLTDGQTGGHAMELKFDVGAGDGASWYRTFSASQDWSGYDGIRLNWRGGKTMLRVYFEIIENGIPALEAEDHYERYVCPINDDFEGWRQVTLRFENFRRRNWQPKGAPNDGLTLDEVRGFAFVIPEGRGSIAVDSVELFRE